MNKIQNKYVHGKYGTFMFKMCSRATVCLCKHKWLYYLLACTWGLLMTLVGLIITGVLAIAKIFCKKIKFKKYNWVYSISVGPDYWGGFETGLMFIRDHKSWTSLDAHEFGHTLQNCILGPLFPILVGIPSALRYWYQEIRKLQNKPNKPYDAMWFEDAASQCGEYANKLLNQ